MELIGPQIADFSQLFPKDERLLVPRKTRLSIPISVQIPFKLSNYLCFPYFHRKLLPDIQCEKRTPLFFFLLTINLWPFKKYIFWLSIPVMLTVIILTSNNLSISYILGKIIPTYPIFSYNYIVQFQATSWWILCAVSPLLPNRRTAWWPELYTISRYSLTNVWLAATWQPSS